MSLYTKKRFKDELCEFSFKLGLPVDAIGKILRLESYNFHGAFEILEKYNATQTSGKEDLKGFIIPLAKKDDNSFVMCEYTRGSNGRKNIINFFGQKVKTWKFKGNQEIEPIEFSVYRAFHEGTGDWLGYPIRKYYEETRDGRKCIYYIAEMPYSEMQKNFLSYSDRDSRIISIDDVVDEHISWGDEADGVLPKLILDKQDGKI